MRVRSILVGVLVLALFVNAVPVSAQQSESGANISVSNVTVSPAEASPGESITISATIENLESSTGTVQIHAVRLRKDNGGILESIHSPGAISRGGQMEVPLSTSFEESGRKTLEVYIRGVDENNNEFELEYPVIVDVSAESSVGLSFDTSADAVVGAETPIEVTVSNGDQSAIRSLRLDLSGRAVSAEENSRVAASLAAGSEKTFTYNATVTEGGEQEIDATLAYTTATGSRLSVTESEPVAVEELEETVDLSAETGVKNGSSVVNVELENSGNAPLEDVDLDVTAEDGDVLSRSIADLNEGESTTTTIDGSRLPTGSLEFVATYTTGGVTGEVDTQLHYQPAPSGIEVTGVESTTTGNSITVSGDVGNVGLTDATGVVVRPVETESVISMNDYFVGTVDSSEYVTFEVSAQTRGNVSSLPLEVAYVVDGEQRTEQIEVNVVGGTNAGGVSGGPQEAQAGGAPENGGPGSALSLPVGDLLGTLLTYLVPIVVLIGAVLAWRRYRGNE